MSEYSTYYPAFEKFLTAPIQDLNHKQFMILFYAAKQEIKGLPSKKVVAITKGILKDKNE
jgi:hypothetical protein